MYDFNYHRPGSVADAISLLSSSSDAQLLAGGQTLLPTMKQRLASPSDLVDISGIADLQGISVDGGGVSIGAGVTRAEVASSADVKGAIPALAALAGNIGDPHVRHRGTIAGSIANNDPAADYPAACAGLGAKIHTNNGSHSADDFFTAMFETALGEDEIITRVTFPVPRRAAYAKFDNPASRYALVGVMVAETGSGVRVAVTGAGASMFRVAEMEQALGDNYSADAIAASPSRPTYSTAICTVRPSTGRIWSV